MAPISSLFSPHSLIKAAKILALMALFLSLAHSSRNLRDYKDGAFWVSKGFDSFESEEKGLVEVSTREVPTGPDPLHHNRFKPIKP